MAFTPLFFFSSRRRHTRCGRDWSSDVCSSDLVAMWVLQEDMNRSFGGYAAQLQLIVAVAVAIGIGRASGRGRGEISGGGVSLKKKKRQRFGMEDLPTGPLPRRRCLEQRRRAGG